jgi:hypothetical protein
VIVLVAAWIVRNIELLELVEDGCMLHIARAFQGSARHRLARCACG